MIAGQGIARRGIARPRWRLVAGVVSVTITAAVAGGGAVFAPIAKATTFEAAVAGGGGLFAGTIKAVSLAATVVGGGSIMATFSGPIVGFDPSARRERGGGGVRLLFGGGDRERSGG